MVGVEEGARISLSRGYVLSREYFPSSSVFFLFSQKRFRQRQATFSSLASGFGQPFSGVIGLSLHHGQLEISKTSREYVNEHLG